MFNFNFDISVNDISVFVFVDLILDCTWPDTEIVRNNNNSQLCCTIRAAFTELSSCYENR